MHERTAGLDRRRLLQAGMAGGLLAAGSSARPRAARQADAATVESEPPVLVLIELFGGNDGLSTLVPYTHDSYYAQRPTLAIPAGEVLPLGDEYGLHPALQGLRAAYDAGQLALVRGIGYPQPVYSHFKSLEIWHTADHAGRAAGDGWVARLGDACFGPGAGPRSRPEEIIHIGDNLPYALQSTERGILAFGAPERYLWAGVGGAEASYREAAERERDPEASPARQAVLSRLYRTLQQSQRTSDEILSAAHAYEPRAEYPTTNFGRSLRTVAALIEARVGTRVFSTNLAGFDTHAKQGYVLPKLLNELDRSLAAFRADLAGRSTAPKVVVAVISEFGRRVAENHSGGTDHGAAGLAMVLGERVKGGLYGSQPPLDELDADGNLVYQVDFRSLYATLIQDWFKTPQAAVLDSEYARLPLLES